MNDRADGHAHTKLYPQFQKGNSSIFQPNNVPHNVPDLGIVEVCPVFQKSR